MNEATIPNDVREAADDLVSLLRVEPDRDRQLAAAIRTIMAQREWCARTAERLDGANDFIAESYRQHRGDIIAKGRNVNRAAEAIRAGV